METEKTTWSEFPNVVKAIVEQIIASEEINRSRIAGLIESLPGIRGGNLTIWVRSFEITEFTTSISSTRTGWPVLMDVKVFKDN